MSLHVLIDGYNLIGQTKHLSMIERRGLEEGREALLEQLATYRRIRHHPVTVVFDGAFADIPRNAVARHKGVNVIFSRPGESADTVIERLVSRERERAIVVSSDREVLDFAYRHGAATISSVEFEHTMRSLTQNHASPADFGDKEEKGWTPTTRKKGPSRRLSKRIRKSRIKTKKL